MNNYTLESSLTEIIRFTHGAEIVYISIGSANNVEQQFLPILGKILQYEPDYKIKIVLFDGILEVYPLSAIELCLEEIDCNRYVKNLIEMFACRTNICHNDLINFDTITGKFILFLLEQLIKNKEKNTLTTNLLIFQDFTGRSLQPLKKRIIEDDRFKSILTNIIIGLTETEGSCSPDLTIMGNFPLFYRNHYDTIEVFSPAQYFSKTELAFFFTSAIDNQFIIDNVIEHIKVILSEITQKIVPGWRYWMGILSGKNNNDPIKQDIFPKNFEIDLLQLKHDTYKNQLMSQITEEMITLTKEILSFCDILGFADKLMQDFYIFCRDISKLKRFNEQYNVYGYAVKCCEKIILFLSTRTNILNKDIISYIQTNGYPKSITNLREIDTYFRWIYW